MEVKSLGELAGEFPNQFSPIALVRWFRREKLAFLSATLVLSLGALSSWYRLPPEALEKFETNLAIANYGKVLAAVLALGSFTFTLWFKPQRIPRSFFWGGLIAVLLFPYAISTWCPTVSFLAASYHDQGEQVAMHVENNFPEIQARWKQNISLYESKPITSVLPVVIKDSRFFQMSSWNRMVEGLGYNNNFWQGIGRGWGLTVTGTAIALIAIYLGLEADRIKYFVKDTTKLLPWIGLGLVILIYSTVFPNIVNYQLDINLVKGEYDRVMTESRAFKSWYPALSGDRNFLVRIAEAEFYLQEQNPSLIDFAKGVERYQLKDLLGAEADFQTSLSLDPTLFLVRGYLATVELNLGVEQFNNRKFGAAVDYFEQVLQIFPAHVEALYYLMLARASNGEFDKSASVARQIIETQQYFQMPGVALLGQAYLHSAWASYHDGNMQQAWEKYRQSIDKSAW